MANLLLVDDEQDVLHVMRDALSMSGFEVTTASGGKAAIRELLGSVPFDFVVSDIHMPEGVSGVEVAAEANRLQPNAQVVLVSGYQRGHLPAFPEGTRFLAKPYRLKQLLDLLHPPV